MSDNITACPLDCFDTCSMEYDGSKLIAKKEGYTEGFLCPHLNHYDSFKRIITPRYKGEEITIDEALIKLKEILNSSYASEVLHYKSHGNFALMQGVTEHFFAQHGAVLTNGSLCDGAGEAGILEGRGSNKNMPLSEIAKSEVVIVWGRNPHTTSSHLLPLLKGKTLIVIDPVRTKIAKMADLYVQIKPHTDIYLAMLIARFLHINDECDEEYLEEFASEFEEYYELTQTVRIKSMLEHMEMTLGQVGKIIELIKNKKVAIVCGVGVQKYRDGADILRAIDSIAVALGLFGKEGCGVAYLGNSQEHITSPFKSKAKRVSKVDTSFDEYKTVFIQAANPLSQMPDTLRVKSSIAHTENVVYFGLYENETSSVADLIIPAKTFLEKDDIRTSYSHNAMLMMNRQLESEIGISEYDLAAYLCNEFDIELKSESEYLEHFKSFADEYGNVKGRTEIPYKNGFDTDDEEFLFLEEVDIDKGANKIILTKNRDKKRKVSQELHLITSKSSKSLNSQFKPQNRVFIHSALGFAQDEKIKISSVNGSVTLQVQHNDDLRKDCILIYSGTLGVNNLTSSKHSYEGKSAVYQEDKVTIENL